MTKVNPNNGNETKLGIFQKQPFRGVLSEGCSKNM